MSFIKSHKTLFIVLLILVSNIFLHFYNLTWGAPFYFHPDERNILYGLTQLTPDKLNPHFFAYGSLPIYVTYVLSLVLTHGMSPIPFETGIVVLRAVSATLATGVAFLIFVTGKKLWDGKTGIIAALFWTFSTGAIQYAHFGTFEMWLTFFSLFLFLQLILYKENPGWKKAVGIGLITGILIATKISSLVFLPIIFILFLYRLFYFPNKRKTIFHFYLFLFSSFILFVVTNPFVFLDKASFIRAITYESNVALGTLPVFYTGGFVQTVPILYQVYHVFPFILNPLMTIFSIICFLLFLLRIVKKQQFNDILLITFFLVLLVSQGILYVKWTRYMIPTLPFIYLYVSPFLSGKFVKKQYQRVTQSLAIFCIVVAGIFSLSFFMTVYIEPDTRIAAANFASENIPHNSPILSEVYDLGIVPFNQYFSRITLFNFYELENDAALPPQLVNLIENNDYIILPSQRILKSRLVNLSAFPKGAQFYIDLMSGEIPFKKIYQTPCSLFCEIAYIGDPIYKFEETATVFDRPTVMIYKRK